MPSLLNFAVRIHNRAYLLFRSNRKQAPASNELKEIEDRAARFPSDISDHLSTIFSETVVLRPRLIVEIGVRGGESRFAFEKAARLSGAFLVSVDLDDCSASCTASPGWHFVKADDVHFARDFGDWCGKRGFAPKIDVLFIDTSHLYEHTVEEVKAWFPYLSPTCKVIFHDTNLRNFNRRSDGTILRGWDNQRGVIRAIEEYLGATLNERADFVTIINEWIVRHWAHCNGLTILERRLPQPPLRDTEMV